MKLMEITEKYRCETEHEAENLILDAKDGRKIGGYSLKDFSSKYKTKVSKGEIIDEWYIVELVKVMED